MNYKVKEIYYTIQGEGAQSGRPAVFCRFSGCNLWSGREKDRDGSVCSFCDTDFVGTDGEGGGVFASVEDLCSGICDKWNGASGSGKKMVVFTGGEPLLQLDSWLVDALRLSGFYVAVETNGTIPISFDVDWLCVSPKAGSGLVQDFGDELKLVFPQKDLPPHLVADLDFNHFFLQPMDGPVIRENIQMAIDYCMSNPKWSLSLQSHKLVNIK